MRRPCFDFLASRENVSVFAVRADGGRLVVAYWTNDEQGVAVNVARGDARGANLRLVASSRPPTDLGMRLKPVVPTGTPLGMLSSDGLVALQLFEDFTIGKPVRKIVILPSGK